jgi:hypothetical protein
VGVLGTLGHRCRDRGKLLAQAGHGRTRGRVRGMLGDFLRFLW